jgi:hypothetical protein
MTVPSGGTNSQTFTIPEEFTPGTYRFRLRCQYSTTAPQPCNGYTYGQTHDYTIILPELYPRVQNVNAILYEEDNKIIINWDAPADGTPIGYNIYREGNKLNATPLTVTNYTETNISYGVYAYNVTAVYEGNKESFAEMSDVICYFYIPVLCEKPVNPNGIAEKNSAIITWDEPEKDGTLINYNIYRDGEKIGETLSHIRIYSDNDLALGAYTYQVSASYGHCSESEQTEGVTVIISCPIPVNLNVEVENCGADITWDEPETTDGLLGYNIYRNEDKINEEPIIETIYFDEILENGTYSYQISALFDYGESNLTEDITVEIICLGIPDYFEASFNLYPNPANGNVTIEGIGLNRIELYDVQARKLNEYDVVNGTLTINVNHYDNGFYFVKMYSETGIMVTKRLVVIK